MSLPRNRFARTSRPDRRRLGGGWLSLFAMWMIFIGPLVSQSMPMDMAMAAEHDHGSAGHHGQADGKLHVVWEKCGYCSLLFNCPALPQTLSPLNAAATLPPLLTPAPVCQGHARQAIFPGARSRAPPLSIIA